MNIKKILIFFLVIFTSQNAFSMQTEIIYPIEEISSLLQQSIVTIREHLKTDYFIKNLNLKKFKQFVSSWKNLLFLNLPQSNDRFKRIRIEIMFLEEKTKQIKEEHIEIVDTEIRQQTKHCAQEIIRRLINTKEEELIEAKVLFDNPITNILLKMQKVTAEVQYLLMQTRI